MFFCCVQWILFLSTRDTTELSLRFSDTMDAWACTLRMNCMPSNQITSWMPAAGTSCRTSLKPQCTLDQYAYQVQAIPMKTDVPNLNNDYTCTLAWSLLSLHITAGVSLLTSVDGPNFIRSSDKVCLHRRDVSLLNGFDSLSLSLLTVCVLCPANFCQEVRSRCSRRPSWPLQSNVWIMCTKSATVQLTSDKNIVWPLKTPKAGPASDIAGPLYIYYCNRRLLSRRTNVHNLL